MFVGDGVVYSVVVKLCVCFWCYDGVKVDLCVCVGSYFGDGLDVGLVMDGWLNWGEFI